MQPPCRQNHITTDWIRETETSQYGVCVYGCVVCVFVSMWRRTQMDTLCRMREYLRCTESAVYKEMPRWLPLSSSHPNMARRHMHYSWQMPRFVYRRNQSNCKCIWNEKTPSAIKCLIERFGQSYQLFLNWMLLFKIYRKNCSPFI